MAATIDLEVSKLIRDQADPDDLNDYIKFRLPREQRRAALSSDERDAIEDRGTYAKILVPVGREFAQYVERRCEALDGRSSIGKRVEPMIGWRSKRIGVALHGWFVSPDGATVQGTWNLTHHFGQYAVVDAELYEDGSSFLKKKAVA